MTSCLACFLIELLLSRVWTISCPMSLRWYIFDIHSESIKKNVAAFKFYLLEFEVMQSLVRSR